MAESRLNAAGGFAAIRYVLDQARESGNSRELVSRLRSANACKTCAVGMGGDRGGMVNEAGHFPEVCKKSVQAQVGDMRPGISEEFFASTDIDQLLAMSSREVEQLGRLAFPIALAPGDRNFRRIAWDDVFELAYSALSATDPQRTFFYMSGRSNNEAAFLTQLVARAYGTPNIHNCSFYCHNASSVALSKVYGTGTSSVDLSDLASTELAVVVGANPASNHPRLITSLVKLRKRGGKVIVINPMSELGLKRFRLPSDVRSLTVGSTVSDIYVQPRVGGDVALMVAVLKRVREIGAVDVDFVSQHTSGWEAVEAFLDEVSWDELLACSGVARQQIDEVAAAVAQARSGVFMWAMGLTHHAHGTDNILALANLALARGFLGRPSSGLLPIRGHSNIQGVGSMGVSPAMKQEFAQRMAARYGVDPDVQPGQDTYGSMVAARRTNRRSCVVRRKSVGSNPDSVWAADAMQRIGFTLSLTTHLNPGHFHGRGRLRSSCRYLPATRSIRRLRRSRCSTSFGSPQVGRRRCHRSCDQRSISSRALRNGFCLQIGLTGRPCGHTMSCARQSPTQFPATNELPPNPRRRPNGDGASLAALVLIVNFWSVAVFCMSPSSTPRMGARISQ